VSGARATVLLSFLATALAGGIATVISVAASLQGRSARQEAVAQPFSIPRPIPLKPISSLVRWAPVERATIARAAPGPAAPPLAHVGRRTPEGTTNIVLVLGRSHATAKGIWLRTRLPGGGIGWLPRRALGGYTVVKTRLVVDRRRLTATLYRDDRRVFAAPVAIGRAGAPTPGGRFYVRDALRRYRSATYGPLAFGTSARAPGVTDWPAGGFVGIHGTDQPKLIPGRVSHGCIRMRNADVLRLGELMTVGTPITIR
jgi:hypothetical protein